MQVPEVPEQPSDAKVISKNPQNVQTKLPVLINHYKMKQLVYVEYKLNRKSPFFLFLYDNGNGLKCMRKKVLY